MSLLTEDIDFLRASDRFVYDKGNIVAVFDNPNVSKILSKVTETDYITKYFIDLYKLNDFPGAEVLKLLFNIQYAEENFSDESITLGGVNAKFNLKNCYEKYKQMNTDYIITYSVETAEEIKSMTVDTINFVFFLITSLKMKSFEHFSDFDTTDKEQISIFAALCVRKYCNDIIGPCALMETYYIIMKVSDVGIKALESVSHTDMSYHNIVIKTMNGDKSNSELSTFYRMLKIKN
jgi:hypothetical protein